MGQSKSQSQLGEFESKVGEVFQDGDDIVAPEVVAGYERSAEELTETRLYEAPCRVDSVTFGGVTFRDDLKLFVMIESAYSEEWEYEVSVSESFERPTTGDFVVKRVYADNKVAAVEEGIEWMQDNPAPGSPEQIQRPTLSYETASVVRRPEMKRRRKRDQAERLREGSTIIVDDLPAATVVEEKDVDEDKRRIDRWECETPDGHQFDIVIYDSTRTRVGYVLEDGDDPVLAQYLRVSNEENLRESVHMPTYEWLKERVGERVIYDGDGETITVKELESVRDGAVNPSGAVDPEDRRMSGTYISDQEAGNWYPCPWEIETGSYRVIESGLVPSNDPYGARVVVPADEWDSHDVPQMTSDDATPTTDVGDLTAPLPGDRPGVSRDDPVTEIIGVGDEKAKKLWKSTVGELYDEGWPLPFVSGQYMSRAIAEMFGVGGGPTMADTIRAVVGMLGGVAFDESGEKIGSTASAIVGTLSVDDAASGWLSYETGIKKEYRPSWAEFTSDDTVRAFGAGEFATKDLEEHLADQHYTQASDSESVEEIQNARFEGDKILASTAERSDMVAVASEGDGPFVEVPKRPLEIGLTIARRPVIDGQDINGVAFYPLNPDDNEGIIVIESLETSHSVVIDTSGTIAPLTFEEEYRETAGEESTTSENLAVESAIEQPVSGD